MEGKHWIPENKISKEPAMHAQRTFFSAIRLVSSIATCFLMMSTATLAKSPTYAVDDISVDPEPVVAGTPTELCVTLRNPTAASITIQVEFSWAELGIGIPFTPISSPRQVVVPSLGEAEDCINWVTALSGPVSIQAKLSMTGSADQYYQ